LGIKGERIRFEKKKRKRRESKRRKIEELPL